jgi:phospholipid transport system substrate-binding protein
MRRAAAVFLAALPGLAAAEPLGPMATTRKALTRSHEIVTAPTNHKQKVRALHAVLREFLDTDAMGRQAMGRHLEGRSEAEVRDFLDVFAELFVRTYVQRLLLFQAPDFGYRSEKIDGSRATVQTEIITPKDRFAVDYRMQKSAQGWQATDILVEDASLGDNFRSQFDAALARESFDSLMERLRKRIDTQKGTEAQTP